MFVTEEVAAKLRAAVAVFEEKPLRLNMLDWVKKSDRAPCGTEACLAGEIALQSKKWKLVSTFPSPVFLPVDVKDDGSGSVGLCRSALHVAEAELAGNSDFSNDYSDYSSLWYLTFWPESFADPYLAAEQDPLKRVAILKARVEHFVETGK